MAEQLIWQGLTSLKPNHKGRAADPTTSKHRSQKPHIEEVKVLDDASALGIHTEFGDIFVGVASQVGPAWNARAC